MNVLNAVGGFHLQGVYRKEHERVVFEQVTKLVMEDRLHDAEEASAAFPFEDDFIELETVTA